MRLNKKEKKILAVLESQGGMDYETLREKNKLYVWDFSPALSKLITAKLVIRVDITKDFTKDFYFLAGTRFEFNP